MDQLSNYPHLSWYISNLRSIPGGQFHWGASPSVEELGIPITMSPFRMGATPVTWGMWKEYHRSVGVPGTDTELDDFSWCGPDDHPAVHVLWDEIMDPGGFCEWASGVAGFTLTIPTDVQWEYAARGGLDGLEYPWGNEFDESKLWFYDEETAAVDRTDRIFRNGYGLTDMVGNVHQWCADYYNEEYRPTGRDPIDRRRSEYRCVRGGSWNDSYPLSFFRCALRFNYFPGGYIDHPIGFRLSAGPVIADKETVFELKDVDEKSVKLLATAVATEDTTTGTRQDINKSFSLRLNNYPALRDYIDSLRVIPGGQFHWGASPSEGESGIPITMSPFRMGATPVTVAVWKEYCAATNIPMPNEPHWGWLDDHPVVKVSWEDIKYPGGFCEWASGVAGFRLTLPTDAQWEYAARGGQDGHDYPWGNNFDESNLWCSEDYGDAGMTAAVDRTNRIYRNGYGLTDMVGNIRQLCADSYNKDYRPTGKDPLDTRQSEYRGRCVRGGSWFNYDPDFFRCADRDWYVPDYWSDYIGFRLSAGPR